LTCRGRPRQLILKTFTINNVQNDLTPLPFRIWYMIITFIIDEMEGRRCHFPKSTSAVCQSPLQWSAAAEITLMVAPVRQTVGLLFSTEQLLAVRLHLSRGVHMAIGNAAKARRSAARAARALPRRPEQDDGNAGSSPRAAEQPPPGDAPHPMPPPEPASCRPWPPPYPAPNCSRLWQNAGCCIPL